MAMLSSLQRLFDRIEWPTVAVAVVIYSGFGLLTWNYDVLPWWLILPLGTCLVAWHGSLQHEAVHRHPTPWLRINELLVFPSLWLWMPYRIYRQTHLAHHNDKVLTDPTEDPESYYVTQESWATMGPLTRGFLMLHNTSWGRLLFGPLRAAYRLLQAEGRNLLAGDSSNVTAWLLHVLSVSVVLGWVLWICGIPFLEYLLLFVYPGISLTLLRSFLEHRAAPLAGHRTVIVEAGPIMSLLLFNNNLHVVHHAEPGLAWYDIPARYRARRAEFLAGNGDYCYSGYGQVILRHFLSPKETPYHPLQASPAQVIVETPFVSEGAA